VDPREDGIHFESDGHSEGSCFGEQTEEGSLGFDLKWSRVAFGSPGECLLFCFGDVLQFSYSSRECFLLLAKECNY